MIWYALNIIKRVLIRGRWAILTAEEECWDAEAGASWERWGETENRGDKEAGRGKETDSPLQPPEGGCPSASSF